MNSRTMHFPIKLTLFVFILSLTAGLSVNAQEATLSDKQKVTQDAKALQIPAGYLNNLKWNLILDSLGENGSAISWKSDNPAYITNEGVLLQRSSDDKEVTVRMTATLTSGKARKTRTFDIRVAQKEPHYDGYLFAYFEGSGDTQKQEQLRFAASADGINWSALNHNEPIIASSEISQTGGIRDPYIMRGEDGHTFYLVATDMFTYKDGWGFNPGIVMMKSGDLTSWSSSIIDLASAYPEKFANIQWVWAPQTIYDPARNQYMIYFTIRFKGQNNLDFYCAYANEDFTSFLEEPTLLFRAKYGAIDGDIIYKDGLYHLFYKGHTNDESGKEVANGIQQATSKTLQGPWVEDFKYLDAYAYKPTVVEGSGIFQNNDTGEYILMYDLYSNLRYEFQRSRDLFRFTETPESFTKDFNPRHGTVMSITAEEAIRLNTKWGGVPEALVEKGE